VVQDTKVNTLDEEFDLSREGYRASAALGGIAVPSDKEIFSDITTAYRDKDLFWTGHNYFDYGAGQEPEPSLYYDTLSKTCKTGE